MYVLNQDEINTLNIFITNNEIEVVVKTLCKKKIKPISIYCRTLSHLQKAATNTTQIIPLNRKGNNACKLSL